MSAAQVAAPYVVWADAEDAPFGGRRLDAASSTPHACDPGRGGAPHAQAPQGPTTLRAAAPRRTGPFTAHFRVGGAHTVDSHESFWGCYDAAAAKAAHCSGADALLELATAPPVVDDAPSPARWGGGADDAADALERNARFQRAATLDLAAARAACGDVGRVWLVAAVKVDGAWADAPPGAQPVGFDPQTHLARARTDASWTKLGANGRAVVGKAKWTTPPLLVDLSPPPQTRKQQRRPLAFGSFDAAAPRAPEPTRDLPLPPSGLAFAALAAFAFVAHRRRRSGPGRTALPP